MNKKLAAITVALLSSVALAQGPAPAPAPTPTKSQAQVDLGGQQDRPWYKGVPPEKQKIAIDMFKEGNGLLKESLFVQAAAKYREALSHWDHPGIHYNLALALLNLDQPVEVFAQLEEAMKYGALPLDADKFEHAGRYKTLIERQLAHVDINCADKGAAVSMDGKSLFTGPGHYEAKVRVGKHTIVAEKAGFITTQKSPTLLAGQKTEVAIKLYTAEDLTHYKRRFPLPVPYVVLVAGVVVAGTGALLHWQASEAYKQYDEGIKLCGGCVPSPSLASTRTTGNSEQTTAFVFYGLGGFVGIAGAVLAFVNRAQPYRVNPEKEGALSLKSVQPYIGSNGAGLVATLHF